MVYGMKGLSGCRSILSLWEGKQDPNLIRGRHRFTLVSKVLGGGRAASRAAASALASASSLTLLASASFLSSSSLASYRRAILSAAAPRLG